MSLLKKLTPKTKKIINIVVDVVAAIVLVFALFLAVCAISSKAKGYSQYTEIFGKAYLGVETDSMEPTFSSGDLIKIKTISGDEARKLKVGDIITFEMGDIDGDGKTDLNTHRIIEIFNGTEGNASSYRTQGDNREVAPKPETVLAENIVGVYQGKASGIGNMFLFMSTSAGFFVCVVLPTLLIVVYCAVNLVLVIRKEKKKQTVEAVQAQIDERERIRQELLAEMQANAAETAQSGEPQTNTETVTEQQQVSDTESSKTEDNKTDEEEK